MLAWPSKMSRSKSPVQRQKSLNDLLAAEAKKVPSDCYDGILPCQDKETGLYPNVDLSIWLRSCTKETDTEDALQGTVRGLIPTWIEGALLQNGPGKFYFGNQVASHLFDGSALLQRYFIEKGQVYYSCRYLRTSHFKKNLAAQNIITNEFATNGANNVVNKTFKSRFSFLFDLSEMMSDNTFISVYPLGKEYFCYYESPFVTKINPDTLETQQILNLNERLGVLSHASHPHYDDHGNMISIGMKLGFKGPEYVVTKVPVGDLADHNKPLEHNVKAKPYLAYKEQLSKFDHAHIQSRIPSRWALDPGYMHSFGLTERYFVLVEQPLSINVPSLVSGTIRRKPMIESMRWYEGKSTIFHVIDRITGEEIDLVYKSASFFFLHVINAFESSNHIVIDICCYSRPDMLYCMYLDALQTAQSDPDYAQLFRGRPQRFVLPLRPQDGFGKHENLVTLDFTTAKAFWSGQKKRRNKVIRLEPEQICDVGCETPTIYYEKYNGKPYRYFYAITSDVDDPESAGKIYKVDTLNHEVKTWAESNTYCAEPMFIPSPEGVDEDEGVVISSMIKGKPEVTYAGLLVLDAKSMTELGRAEWHLESPVPKPLHGFFTGNNLSAKRQGESRRKKCSSERK